MEEIKLFDESEEEKKHKNKNRIKSHQKHHHIHKTNENLPLVPSHILINGNRIDFYNKQKNLKEEEKNSEIRKNKIQPINCIYEEKNINNKDNLNLNKIKRKISKFNSISSNCSNIQVIEPLSLLIHKNDPLIYSIVKEMKKSSLL